MKANRLLLGSLVALIATGATALAQNHSEFDRYRAGSQYLAYPVPEQGTPQLSEAPKGYAPFHMEHYGRHGSRWLLADDDYAKPLKYLRKAADASKLTERGLLLIEQLESIKADATNRRGELSPLGHAQHRGIAARMTQNFPELFTDGTHVDAKSTVVIRCILSMANEIAELQSINPNISVTCDATRTYQRILAPNSSDTVATKIIEAAQKKYSDPYAKSHRLNTDFMCKIFSDTAWARKNMKIKKLFERTFEIATNAQSHEMGPMRHPDLYDLFTPEELEAQWKINNVWWYINAGNTSLTDHRVPRKVAPLVRNIVESADTAMMSERKSVNLRFGHESIVLPLCVIMGINDAAYDTEDLETLHEHWRNYDTFMMASNVQIVFYRPVDAKAYGPDDVLVKVLLNEAEARLPLEPVAGPYYRWTDLRNHLLSQIPNPKSQILNPKPQIPNPKS